MLVLWYAIWCNRELCLTLSLIYGYRNSSNTCGVHVLRSPNFFSREWKQIETWKLLEETWLFFRLGEDKWQHCTTRWMLVTRSSCSSVFDTEMATFTFEEQRVIIRFLHLRGMKPIEMWRGRVAVNHMLTEHFITHRAMVHWDCPIHRSFATVVRQLAAWHETHTRIFKCGRIFLYR